jgi:hypothetical protein
MQAVMDRKVIDKAVQMGAIQPRSLCWLRTRRRRPSFSRTALRPRFLVHGDGQPDGAFGKIALYQHQNLLRGPPLFSA